MRADDRALADLAGSVADGQPVDWQATEARADVRDRRLIRHLRLVESIASLYRSLPEDDEAEGPAVPPAAEPTGPRWGRLVMLERIGHGTSGDVFRAWDTELHREVAVKLLHDDGGASQAGPQTGGAQGHDTHARVLQEARRLARVRHPHVVQVYGAEQHDGRVGLWMELVRGESLEQILAARGPFGPREAALVGQDICAALAAVHGAGLLHRDVKAQNVVRESGGRTVLMDFGTGEELRQDAGTTRMAGTPLYLAPEIFKGQAASIQSDLYSLGVLLFYLASGQFPVTAGSIEQLGRAHAHQQKRRLRDLRPDLPASFVQVIECALEHEPAKRYRTAGEMEAALRASADTFQQTAVVPEVGWFSFSRRIALAAATLVVTAVAVGLIVWSRGGGTSPGSGTTTSSVAVLPLSIGSGPSSAPYFAEGLTDQLITTLGQVSALKVTSLTSVRQFKEPQRTTEEIASRLKVDAVLEGTVMMVGGGPGDPGRVRVNARLIAAGGGILWSRTFERAQGDTLALEAELARAIADGVDAALTPGEHRRLSQTRSTNAAAEQAYFQGLYHLNQLGADSARAAIDAFRRATELDSNHAPAHAGLARAYITQGFMGVTSQAQARAMGLAEASRAVELDPELSGAHEVIADLKFYYDWDWNGADAAYRKAIELNPNSDRAHSQYSRFLIARGRGAEALLEADRAQTLDPLSSGAKSTQALIHYYSRDYDRALEAASHALQLDPRSAGVYFILARVHAARGAWTDAISANERAIDLAGRASTGWRAHLIKLQAQAGKASEARIALSQLTDAVEDQHERIGGVELAYVQMALGNPQGALDLLGRAADDRDPDLLWLAVDPRADPLRSEPRFGDLVTRLGLAHLTRQ